MKVKVLFVCLGNICRSPLAEALFNKHINDHNLADQISCDSAGTSGYHIGQLADERMRKTAAAKGINLTHRARQIQVDDLATFTYVIPMDEMNLNDIKSLTNTPKATIALMRSFGHSAEGLNVPDPYFGGEEGFYAVYDMLHYHTLALLNNIKKSL